MLAYFLICGLRFIFDIPAELNANWVHKVILDRESHASAAVARKIILTFILPWVLVVCLPLYLYYWGWTVGGGLIAVMIAGCYLLTDSCCAGSARSPSPAFILHGNKAPP